LLAEDNELNLMTTVEYLEAMGHEVVVAHNGREALALAHETRPHVILMDIQMPEMDGLEATRRLRARPETAVTPVIALTALAMPGDRERCLAAGATAYLTKPVSLKGLAELIARLTQIRALS
jgi:CheY-like chemotaxis protein